MIRFDNRLIQHGGTRISDVLQCRRCCCANGKVFECRLKPSTKSAGFPQVCGRYDSLTNGAISGRRTSVHETYTHMVTTTGYYVVMGDSARKKRIRFESVPQTSRFDSIRFTALSESPSTVHTRGSGLWS